MATEDWTGRWWQASVILLAGNSVVFGFLFIDGAGLEWGIALGFAPAVLLLTGLAMRHTQRLVATAFLTVGSIGAALAWWVIYTVALALVIVGGGFASGSIGPIRPQREATV